MHVRARIDRFEQEEQHQVKRLFRATTVGRALIYNDNLRVENSSRLSNPLIRHDTRRIYFTYTYTYAHICTRICTHECIDNLYAFILYARSCVCTYTGTLEIGARSRIEDERPC